MSEMSVMQMLLYTECVPDVFTKWVEVEMTDDNRCNVMQFVLCSSDFLIYYVVHF